MWGYAAANFVLGAVIPPGADIVYLMGTESAMAFHITAILYILTAGASEAAAALAGGLIAAGLTIAM